MSLGDKWSVLRGIIMRKHELFSDDDLGAGVLRTKRETPILFSVNRLAAGRYSKRFVFLRSDTFYANPLTAIEDFRFSRITGTAEDGFFFASTLDNSIKRWKNCFRCESGQPKIC